MVRLFCLAIVVFVLSAIGMSQSPVSWTLESDARGKGEVSSFKVKLTAKIDAPWHLYSIDQPPGGPIPTTISVPDGSLFKLGAIVSPRPQTQFDPNFQIPTRFFAKEVAFDIPVTASAGSNVDDLALHVKYQVCNETTCLPPKTVRVTFAGFEDTKKNIASNTTSLPEAAATKGEQPTTNNQPPADLGPFIWLAITLGALSLLTPCVFPMIPITVSYFTNHAAGSRSRSVKLATIYSLGIIATFTLLGMALAIFVGAAGINLFAANPWINLLIAAIFLFFAFNLFGAYELTVPTRVLNKLDAFTRSKEGEGSGIVGALLMGLTFTLTSFTCTSPFVGTILVSAAQGDWKRPFIGMLAYSAVFALPFFILALVPQWVSQLPRAGGWMNSIKVAMGFLEVAAAMKFISNVDLVWKWGIFTRDVVLAVWIAIGVVMSLYLLGKFQLSHDSKPERLGALRMFSAVITLAVSFYLLTGLFGAKLGELESFLPPDLNNSSSRFFNKAGASEPSWILNDYPAALTKAKAENKHVFLDFTGFTCTNCRWMEANVFPKPEVEAELRKFILARLYTDGQGEVYERQQQLEQDNYGTVALPFYAIVDGDGKTIATFPGLTRNVAEFVDFLKKAQKN